MDNETITQRGLPSTMKRARALGYKRYFTGKPCKQGHIAERLANNGHCLTCHNEASKKEKLRNAERERQYRERNKERHNEVARDWARRNPESRRESLKKYTEANPEKVREAGRKWRRENPERQRRNERRQYENNRVARLESASRHKRRNRAAFTAIENERRAHKLQATPWWADVSEMMPFYEDAHRLTQETGELHSVDHIVPLLSNHVCGLHVAANLQVLAQSENARKGNRWWPDMPASLVEPQQAAAETENA